MKFKVDQYRVRGKKQTYDVLVFPCLENAWAYDDWPEESGPRVDGDHEFYRLLEFALAALISDASKIVYFPIRQKAPYSGYSRACDLVLLRPELQFRRSEWFRLKKKLHRQHWVGKYTVRYDQQKLLDYDEKMLEGKRRWLEREEHYVEEMLGDTVFLVLPKERCYWYHGCIADSSLMKGEGSDEHGTISDFAWIGWILADKTISDMKKREKS